MALSITANATALEGLRALKFGIYASFYDVAAPEQNIIKEDIDTKLCPITNAGWYSDLNKYLGTRKYGIFAHDTSMRYIAVPGFLRQNRKFDIIVDQEKMAYSGAVGNLEETISFFTPGTNYLAFSGPFMGYPIEERPSDGLCFHKGVDAWKNMHNARPQTVGITYTEPSPLPGKTSRLAFNQGDIVRRSDTTGFSGCVPMIYDGIPFWPKTNTGGPILTKDVPGKIMYPLPPGMSLNLYGTASQEMASYVVTNDKADRKPSTVGRSLIAYSEHHDMLVVMVHEHYSVEAAQARTLMPFKFGEIQLALTQNFFENAVFTDGSDSVFLFERKPMKNGRYIVDSLFRATYTAIIKNCWWLPVASKISID